MGSCYLTVAICTYNRCELLSKTLESLAIQAGVNWDNVEVLVVDNNCADNTKGVVEGFQSRLPIRRLVEQNQGLSHARNGAIKEAAGEWIVFTDDDVILDPNWLASFQRVVPRFEAAEFAGGRILPLWPDSVPDWWTGEKLHLLDGVLVWYDPGGESRYYRNEDPEPFGATLAVRRSLIEKVGVFRTDLGNNGGAIGRGEDTELIIRARSAAIKGVYVSEALCWHPVELRRLQVSYLYRHGVACGRTHRAIGRKPANGSGLTAALFALRGLIQLLKGRGDRFRQCIINAGIQIGLKETRPTG